MRTLTQLLRRTAVVVSLIVLVSLVLVVLDRQAPSNPLRAFTATALAPVNAGARAVGGALSSVTDSFGEVRDLRRENDELRRLVDQLTSENAQVQSLRQQNERLRLQLGFRDARPDLNQLPAEVVFRDPTSLRKYLIIDRGRRDGVEKGMAVVSPAGLVGRIETVDEQRSRVLLVIDGASAVRAQLQESRADGIVYGRWPLGRLTMRWIDTTAQVKEGAFVFTSGLDDELPRDLPIAVVQRVSKTDVQETQEAELAPLVDPDTLESVAVILRTR